MRKNHPFATRPVPVPVPVLVPVLVPVTTLGVR